MFALKNPRMPRARGTMTTLSSLRTLLALNRTVGIVLISVLFFGLGEQLWSPFFPVYLDAKMNGSAAGAIGGVSLTALLAVGVYACLRNLFEAACLITCARLLRKFEARFDPVV
jgi:hypothetical protein